jgi:hypothetical protein
LHEAAAGHGPAQFVAGLVLSMYLPGRLAVAVLLPEADRYLRLTLTFALSLAATALVGLVVAATRTGFAPAHVANGLAGLCVLLAVAAAVGEQGSPAAAPPRASWAALPAVVLTVVLVAQLVAATRHRGPDSYYTQLALVPAGTGGSATVEVYSRERDAVGFRYEERAGGAVLRAVDFMLLPGERRTFELSTSDGTRKEVLLFRDGQRAPYRRLVF